MRFVRGGFAVLPHGDSLAEVPGPIRNVRRLALRSSCARRCGERWTGEHGGATGGQESPKELTTGRGRVGNIIGHFLSPHRRYPFTTRTRSVSFGATIRCFRRWSITTSQIGGPCVPSF